MSRKQPKVKVIIKTVPHPNPERVIELFAKLVLKEIMKNPDRYIK